MKVITERHLAQLHSATSGTWLSVIFVRAVNKVSFNFVRNDSQQTHVATGGAAPSVSGGAPEGVLSLPQTLLVYCVLFLFSSEDFPHHLVKSLLIQLLF